MGLYGRSHALSEPFPECPHYEPIIDVDRSDRLEALSAALAEAKREIIKLRADNARLSRQVIMWARQ